MMLVGSRGQEWPSSEVEVGQREPELRVFLRQLLFQLCQLCLHPFDFKNFFRCVYPLKPFDFNGSVAMLKGFLVLRDVLAGLE